MLASLVHSVATHYSAEDDARLSQSHVALHIVHCLWRIVTTTNDARRCHTIRFLIYYIRVGKTHSLIALLWAAAWYVLQGTFAVSFAIFVSI